MSRSTGKKGRKGGLYYPAGDRSVPSWGVDSPEGGGGGGRRGEEAGGDGAALAATRRHTMARRQSVPLARAARRPAPQLRRSRARPPPRPKPTLPLPVAIDSGYLGYAEAFMAAPTIPLKGNALGGTAPHPRVERLRRLPPLHVRSRSGAARGPRGTKVGLDLPAHARQGQEGGRRPWAPQAQDGGHGDALGDDRAHAVAVHCASDGSVKRVTPTSSPPTVSEAFEREALNFAAFNTRSLTTVVHRNGTPPSILDEKAMRDLTKETGDLSGISALQLYVQSKGGNGSRYVCEYAFDREVRRMSTTVHKRVYLGQVDGIGYAVYGNIEAQTGDKPIAHPINSQQRWLNDHLCAATRELCEAAGSALEADHPALQRAVRARRE